MGVPARGSAPGQIDPDARPKEPTMTDDERQIISSEALLAILTLLVSELARRAIPAAQEREALAQRLIRILRSQPRPGMSADVRAVYEAELDASLRDVLIDRDPFRHDPGSSS
jgi:hypothetical protein